MHAINATIARDLGALVGAGVSVPRALELLSKRYHHKRVCAALGACAESTGRGISLAQSFSQHPQVFPAITLHMAYVGEQCGDMQASLSALARELAQAAQRETAARAHTLLPIKILLTALALFAGLMVVILLILALHRV